MAQMRSAFFLSLLVLAIYNPRAHASILPLPLPLAVQGLLISGKLCLTSAGNCPGSPASNIVVSVSCATLTGIRVGLATNTTDAEGLFTIFVRAAPGLIFGYAQIPCLVKVPELPLNATVCPPLSNTTGVINGIIQPVGTVISGLLGTIRTANVTLYAKVTM